MPRNAATRLTFKPKFGAQYQLLPYPFTLNRIRSYLTYDRPLHLDNAQRLEGLCHA